MRKYDNKNYEKYKEKIKAYHKLHSEKYKAYQIEWRLRNKEKIKGYYKKKGLPNESFIEYIKKLLEDYYGKKQN